MARPSWLCFAGAGRRCHDQLHTSPVALKTLEIRSLFCIKYHDRSPRFRHECRRRRVTHHCLVACPAVYRCRCAPSPSIPIHPTEGATAPALMLRGAANRLAVAAPECRAPERALRTRIVSLFAVRAGRTACTKISLAQWSPELIAWRNRWSAVPRRASDGYTSRRRSK